MANTVSSNTFFGYLPFGQLEGVAPTGGFTRMFIPSSDTNAYFSGDTVKDSTGGVGPNAANYLTVDASGFGLVRGVFMGQRSFNNTVGRIVWQRWSGGTLGSSLPDAEAYVIDNPMQYFKVQGSSGAVIATSVVGLNVGTANLTAGSCVDGHSAAFVSTQNIGSTNTLPFRVMDTYANYGAPSENGTDNTTAGTILIVRPNNWTRNSYASARSS